ncbi:MAG: M15 family metallopeptidase [Pseudomonadota bacterium]
MGSDRRKFLKTSAAIGVTLLFAPRLISPPSKSVLTPVSSSGIDLAALRQRGPERVFSQRQANSEFHELPETHDAQSGEFGQRSTQRRKIDDRIAVEQSNDDPSASLEPENHQQAAADSGVLDNVLLRDNPHKEMTAPNDIVVSGEKRTLMVAVFQRLSRLQQYVGYGNFNIISWDESLQYARRAPSIGEFTVAELAFIDEVFSTNASHMGFYGDKVVTEISAKISKNEVQKIPHTGHYLFKGKASETYQKIRRDIGETIVLTSGIRGVVKQIFLFLNKAIQVDGNLSIASFSLAPPGHSYHAIGDFDVGKVGFGRRNFTEEFSETDEFKRLSDFGYFDIRYPQNNPFWVRYEPWHINVV